MVKPKTYQFNWHRGDNGIGAIYSTHFDPHGKGRFATAGGDNNVRLWKLETNGEDRKITYLSTLTKHTQAVNVVRFAPRGEILASAGDDGNVLLWIPSETHTSTPVLGEEKSEDQETWRIKSMCRSAGSEIYDLAWSPDAVYIITGSTDNIARIYNAQNGQHVRQIAEHNHYVQGVAWDPLNDFVATQSSDRAVHIYTLKTKDGQFSLADRPHKHAKLELAPRRVSSNSPVPPEIGPRASFVSDASSLVIASPAPSMPGTPTSLSLPMNPPAIAAHSRRSSFSSSPSIRRSASPAPSLPLPAVRPMEVSPRPMHGLGMRTLSYANEMMTTYFRRLTFTPDGALLLTPAGQYKTSHPNPSDGAKSSDDVINTVYIYTRAGLNKPPVAHLPGHRKASIAVRCSPIFYTHRKSSQPTKTFTIDTSSSEESMPALPEPAVSTTQHNVSSVMDPPPLVHASPGPTSDPSAPVQSPKPDTENSSTPGPQSAFALPYRMVYAVATQDAVLLYDTQQLTPLCIVSNLHPTSFTDLTWSNDGLTLLMSSTDGYCSTLNFSPGELGQIYANPPSTHHQTSSTAVSSNQSTPVPTPTSATAPALHVRSLSSGVPPSPSPPVPTVRPSSPTRSNSTSSVATQSSFAPTPGASIISNPTPTLGTVPSLGATMSGFVGGVPLTTPPQTPASAASSVSGQSVLGKRDATTAGSEDDGESKGDGTKEKKRRRVAPTLVLSEGR